MVYFSASFYYVRYSVLGKIIAKTYSRFSLRVWLFSVGFIFLYSLHQFISLICRAIDEVFYRGYKTVQIKEPVFIIANPRSGTTYLHRLIALDEDRFTYTKYAHTFFMSVSFAQLYRLARWMDNKLLKKLISKTMDKLDDRFWGGWDDVHAMGFNKAEEDELLFAQMMMSTGVMIPFPYFDEIRDTNFLDNAPADVRKNVMDFYESCLQRFVHATGRNKTYLAKNVMSTGRFKTLLERFPDARVVYIVRHPYDSVPSMASMFSMMYKFPKSDNGYVPPAKKAWADLSVDFYKYSKEMRSTIAPHRFVQLKYDDLLANPQGTVLKIYQQFGWQPSEKFLAKLAKEEVRNKNYKSAHEYSLEQFGYTKHDIYAELGDIMDEFGFEKEF